MLDVAELMRVVAGSGVDLSDQGLPPVREVLVGNRAVCRGDRVGIMGVVNLSTDSWYRESVCVGVEQAVRRGRVLAAQGADLVDVGAESSLLNAERVDGTTQESRLVPVIRELVDHGILVSVETYYAEVARVGLETGARVINLTGTGEAPLVFRLAAEHGAAVIVCYVQGANVREVGDLEVAEDWVGAMKDFFSRQIDVAAEAGLDRLILDPGLGFYYRNLRDSAARIRYQMETFLTTFRLRALGFPVCHALPHAFETFGEEVRSAEPFFAVLAALGGTSLFRTHEVAKVNAVLETMALWGGNRGGNGGDGGLTS